MITQTCALCGKDKYIVLYRENFDIKNITSRTFSARRIPDRVHYQIVSCRKCRLVYSTPVLEFEKIEKLYKNSFTDYDAQVANLNETYGTYLKMLELHNVKKERLLDIGCGPGFFLQEALSQGYREVYGVEPGKKSVQKASPTIKKNIIIDIFKPGLFKKNYFDVITCFQTLDHIPDPNEFLAECYRVLKKGGFALFLNHDVGALTNRLLGESSPIIDIEHTYLFSKITMRKIFQKHHFKVLSVDSAYNIHSISHWIALVPISKTLKLSVLKLLTKLRISNLRIKFYPGNLVLYAKK